VHSDDGAQYAAVNVLRRIMGDDVDPRMASLWSATTLGFAGVFSFLAFFGIFLVRELDTSASEAGVVLGVGAGAGVAGAFLGGALSDRLGRKPVIVGAAAAQTAAATAFALYGHQRPVAYAVLLALNFLQPLRGATQRAFAADLAAEGDTERQLAFLRVGVNLGASAGPGLGALLVSISWGVQQSFTATAFALSLAAALRLPASPARPRASARGAGVLRDRTFVALFVGGALAWTVFAALETLLPVILSATGRVSPAGWGVLLALNPVLIVVAQMRVSRWTAGWARRRKLILALALISVPYLALTASAAAWVLVAVVLTVTAGEMLFGPSSEALAAEAAPPGQVGAYLGAATAGNWIGAAAAPAIGLPVADALGEAALRGGLVAVAACAAACYWRASAQTRSGAQAAAGAPLAQALP
jgi:predicted MFS family arabinose efflux permease